jgi:L-cysteine:1D-myo-inositol 2-amino-2-deoxy-alpha-D-glucopyranoside ligase
MTARSVRIARAERQHLMDCKLTPAHVAVLLSDTLSDGQKRIPEGPVKLYVCGVTPYDTTHLGHAFTFVQFDTLVRALHWLTPERRVIYVQNVTDIDDSILIRARKLQVNWRALGSEQLQRYLADMADLHVAPPDHLVPATGAIPTMQQIITRLLERDAAYVVERSSVFFRVATRPSYGELSRLSHDQMLRIAGQQDDADVDDPRKEDPLDFALWKGWSGREDEPCWDSPWGRGRPGWHVECSALCYRYLGEQVTIHGGGADLVYPHHESEIAQSETAFSIRPFVQIWAHTAMVRMDGEKMSKSLGNMVFLRDLLQNYSPNALRLFLLGHHYRRVWEWSQTDLDDAASLAAHLEMAIRQPSSPEIAGREAFADALRRDLDTPAAIEILRRMSGAPLRELGGVLGLRFA